MLHPCKGVKTPTVPQKPLRIVTPDEFDAFYRHLPDDLARLVVELDIDSGLRWGELTELRVNDFDFTTNLVTVDRRTVPGQGLSEGPALPTLQAQPTSDRPGQDLDHRPRTRARRPAAHL
jgi:integrase